MGSLIGTTLRSEYGARLTRPPKVAVPVTRTEGESALSVARKSPSLQDGTTITSFGVIKGGTRHRQSSAPSSQLSQPSPQSRFSRCETASCQERLKGRLCAVSESGASRDQLAGHTQHFDETARRCGRVYAHQVQSISADRDTLRSYAVEVCVYNGRAK